MKPWLIIAVTAMAVSYPAEQQQHGSSEHQKEAKQSIPSTVLPAPALVGQPGPEIINCRCSEDTKGILEKATSPETWPNWAVVIAALGAIWVGYRSFGAVKDQADATRLAAEATRDSVRLQEVAMQQWLVIEGWWTSFDNRDNSIQIIARIRNPTALPLTILEYETKGGKIGYKWSYNRVLAPNDSFPVKIQTDSLDERGVKAYMETGIDELIGVIVDYKDCFEVVKSQEFKGLIRCCPGKPTFTEFSGAQKVKSAPTDRPTKEGQSEQSGKDPN
jgi:hypothetical protein